MHIHLESSMMRRTARALTLAAALCVTTTIHAHDDATPALASTTKTVEASGNLLLSGGANWAADWTASKIAGSASWEHIAKPDSYPAFASFKPPSNGLFWFHLPGQAHYDEGKRVAGALTSDWFALWGKGNLLSFSTLEQTDGSTDARRIQIQVGAGNTWLDVGQSSWASQTHDVDGTTTLVWRRFYLSLDKFATGVSQQARVRFLFDSQDGEDNAYKGWLLTSIELRRTMNVTSWTATRELPGDPAQLGRFGLAGATSGRLYGAIITPGGDLLGAHSDRDGEWTIQTLGTGYAPSTTPVAIYAGGTVHVFARTQSQQLKWLSAAGGLWVTHAAFANPTSQPSVAVTRDSGYEELHLVYRDWIDANNGAKVYRNIHRVLDPLKYKADKLQIIDATWATNPAPSVASNGINTITIASFSESATQARIRVARRKNLFGIEYTNIAQTKTLDGAQGPVAMAHLAGSVYHFHRTSDNRLMWGRYPLGKRVKLSAYCNGDAPTQTEVDALPVITTRQLQLTRTGTYSTSRGWLFKDQQSFAFTAQPPSALIFNRAVMVLYQLGGVLRYVRTDKYGQLDSWLGSTAIAVGSVDSISFAATHTMPTDLFATGRNINSGQAVHVNLTRRIFRKKLKGLWNLTTGQVQGEQGEDGPYYPPVGGDPFDLPVSSAAGNALWDTPWYIVRKVFRDHEPIPIHLQGTIVPLDQQASSGVGQYAGQGSDDLIRLEPYETSTMVPQETWHAISYRAVNLTTKSVDLWTGKTFDDVYALFVAVLDFDGYPIPDCEKDVDTPRRRGFTRAYAGDEGSTEASLNGHGLLYFAFHDYMFGADSYRGNAADDALAGVSLLQQKYAWARQVVFGGLEFDGNGYPVDLESGASDAVAPGLPYDLVQFYTSNPSTILAVGDTYPLAFDPLTGLPSQRLRLGCKLPDLAGVGGETYGVDVELTRIYPTNKVLTFSFGNLSAGAHNLAPAVSEPGLYRWRIRAWSGLNPMLKTKWVDHPFEGWKYHFVVEYAAWPDPVAPATPHDVVAFHSNGAWLNLQCKSFDANLEPVYCLYQINPINVPFSPGLNLSGATAWGVSGLAQTTIIPGPKLQASLELNVELEPGGYQVRLLALDASGQISGWSDPVSFTIKPPEMLVKIP